MPVGLHDTNRRHTIDLAMDEAARRDPSLRRYLSDRSVRSWIRDWWSLNAWAWHGDPGDPSVVDFRHMVHYIAGTVQDPFIDVLLSENNAGQPLRRRLLELRPDVLDMTHSSVTIPPKPVWIVDETIPGMWYWGRYVIVFDGDAEPDCRFEVYRDYGHGSEWIDCAPSFEEAAGISLSDSMEMIE